ncbi:MAG TPA: hypothetical protein VGJ49_06980 [Gaiellaceae bacterium]
MPTLVYSHAASAFSAVHVEDAEALVWRDKDGRPVGRAFKAENAHVIELDGVARFVFGSEGPDVRVAPAPGVANDVVEEYFRRWILPVVVQTRGLEVVHASAVVSPRGVVAFSAASEAGKSTLAYGLGRRGYRIWTDDALAFDAGEHGAETLPLPFRLRLRPASAEHFGLEPRLGGTIVEQSEGDHGVREPIAELFLLERRNGGRPVEVERVDPIDAFPALLEGSYHFGLEDGPQKRDLLDGYLALATRVPVFRLKLATGLANLDAALDAVEERF